MKKVLFFTVIGIFISTAIVTILGLMYPNLVQAVYLEKLFYLLIVEVVASVVGLFKATDFFSDGDKTKETKANIVMLPKDDFPRSLDPHFCSVKFFNRETGHERALETKAVRENGYLSIFLDSLLDDELIKISVENASQNIWESDYFSPSTIKAELERV